MPNEWRALRSGESLRERKQMLERAHEEFVSGLPPPESDELSSESSGAIALAGVRRVVLDSWLRSRAVDPDLIPDREALGEDELEELRRTHPIGRVLPVVQRLLFDEASESGFIVAVGDAAGRLLWLDGDRSLRSRAEDMGFRAGMDWSEQAVGTSAPGSALALDHSIQVLGAEHYNRAVHRWSCTAAPVHDPVTGAIVGVVDVTGGDNAASPHILPLIEATLAAVEAELKLESLRAVIGRNRSHPVAGSSKRSSSAAGPPVAPRAASARRVEPRVVEPAPRVVLLGRDPALFEYAGAVTPLSGRHAEILLALAATPAGLGAGALAEQVYGSTEAEPTLRPELVRLRRWLAQQRTGLELLSRPYRLSRGIRIDALDALEALTRGAHRLALAAYEGPALPGSVSPVAEALRGEVDATLREAMLQSATPDLLFEYGQNWGRDDAEVWETLLQVLPPLSPKRSRAVARLEQLRR